MCVTGIGWEGVYSSFKEAGGDNDAFDSDIWVNKQKNMILDSLEKYSSSSFTTKDYPLSLVVSMNMESNSHMNILDFGGGMGAQYLELITKVPLAKEKVNYYIVDGKSSIKNKPVELDQFKQLYFHVNLDNINIKMDIIHIGSTLQYIENWQMLLQQLSDKYKPKYFVFSDVLAGNIPTFVSHQIFYSKKIPITMLNIEEFRKILVNLNFLEIYKSLYQTTILNNSVLPNHALPTTFRLKHSINLIYKYIGEEHEHTY